jgi:hypothetical protein
VIPGHATRKEKRQAFWEVNKNIIRHRERLEAARLEREEGMFILALPCGMTWRVDYDMWISQCWAQLE